MCVVENGVEFWKIEATKSRPFESWEIVASALAELQLRVHKITRASSWRTMNDEGMREHLQKRFYQAGDRMRSLWYLERQNIMCRSLS